MTIRGFAKPPVVHDSLVTAQQSAALPSRVASPSLHLLATAVAAAAAAAAARTVSTLLHVCAT
jgi:hypothetical protein